MFKAKEIRNRSGVLHFERWRVLSLPWLRLYVHRIHRADEDQHLHSHPWHFLSLILRGCYTAVWKTGPEEKGVRLAYARPGRLLFMRAEWFHRVIWTPRPAGPLQPEKPVWTLVLAWGRRREWGYLTSEGFLRHDIYRERKRHSQLPSEV